MASKTDKGAAKTETKAPKGKGKTPERWGQADPRDLYIVGLDEGFREGEPGFSPELFEPDRIKDRPSDDAVALFKAHGCDPVCVVRVSLKDVPGGRDVLVVAKGRQRTMSARIVANSEEEEKAVKVFYFVQETSDALDVTRENEFRKRRTPLEKANHAARLAKFGKKEAEILTAFSDDGANAITKMTLINWKRAANVCAEIQARCEAGEFSITVLYEIGKIGYKGDLDLAEKTCIQLEALAKIEAEGGTLKGKAGRANASAAASGEEPCGGDSGGGESAGESTGGGGGGGKTKSAKLSPEVLREIAAIFAPDEEEEPYTDMLRTGDTIGAGKDKGKRQLAPSRVYVDGDYQLLTHAILAAVTGEDPTGEALQAFPSVYKHVKRFLRS